MTETRKIAAILAADIVGFSRLAGADEDDTLARLRALRTDLTDPAVAMHRGRVVKRTGDGLIVEFRSVVDAVRSAIEIQNGMVGRNAGVAADKRIEFRIGVHLGDVVEEADGDLMGDGVNIAARLESIAEPGGICLSEDAWRQVRDRVKETFVDRGEQALKNIARPVRVYALEAPPSGPGSAPGPAPAAAAEPAHSSIAVLPFANMSGDVEQEYFADGISEDIITALSKLPQLFVIARNSAFTFKGKNVNVGEVGKSLGVRHVLEGSVRTLDPGFAPAFAFLAATLANAYSNGWGDKPAAALEEAEKAALQAVKLDERYPYALWSLGMTLSWARRNDEALAAAQKAIAFNPNFADGQSMVGIQLHFLGRSAEAIPFLERAMALDPHFNSIMLYFRAQALYQLGRYAEAVSHLKRRILRNPETDASRVLLAASLGQMGLVDEAREAWREALAINPAYSLEQRRTVMPYKNPADFERIVEGLRKAGLP